VISVLLTPVAGWLLAKAVSRGLRTPDPIGFIACWAFFALAFTISWSYLALALYLLSITMCMFKFYGINITKRILPFLFKK
jgi:hypothetical protein